MKKINLKGISTATWARLAGAGLVFANQVCISIFDFTLLPFDDAEIYEKVSTFATIIAGIVIGWKDTPVTAAAQEGHRVTKKLKKGVE